MSIDVHTSYINVNALGTCTRDAMAAELPLTLDLTNLFYTEIEGSKIQATLGEQ